LDYARLAPGEAFDRVTVEVVFLRMDQAPRRPLAVLPPGVVLRNERLSVAEYLARHLASPALAIHVLRVDGQVAGFFETDAGYWPQVNLNYFGLMPGFIGKGLGRVMLDAAVDSVFAGGSPLRGMTVNTCSADHPRALPNYVAAGFRQVRRVQEEWDIPHRLGLRVPEHLRG
jgi:hypothetical protein